MTKRQKDVYDYIVWFKQTNGFSPTLDEMSKSLYTSKSFIRQCVIALDEQGYIQYNNKKRRSIVVLR